jgi:hypothetical protein
MRVMAITPRVICQQYQSDAGPNLHPIATRGLWEQQMTTMTMENQTVIRTHKGTGIASFIIGVTCIVTVVALIGFAGVMTSTGRVTPELNMIIGLGMITACFVDLIGIGLGLFGAADRSSKKVYPVLGLVLNVVVVALFAVLLIIGLSMKPA